MQARAADVPARWNITRDVVSDGARSSRKRGKVNVEGVPGDLSPIVSLHETLVLGDVQSPAGRRAEGLAQPACQRGNIADRDELRARAADFTVRRNIAQNGGAAVA